MDNRIDNILFKRIAPAKKLDIVDNFTPAELLAVSPAAIKRIIREVGRKVGNTRGKELYISREFRTGNDWNSEVEGVGYNSKGLFLYISAQYSNTDRTVIETWDKFFQKGQHVGRIEYTDAFDHKQTARFIYYDSEKARVIRRLLMQYLHLKHKDKLVKSEAA